MIRCQVDQLQRVALPDAVDPPLALRMGHCRVRRVVLGQPPARLQVGAGRAGIRAHDDVGRGVALVRVEGADLVALGLGGILAGNGHHPVPFGLQALADRLHRVQGVRKHHPLLAATGLGMAGDRVQLSRLRVSVQHALDGRLLENAHRIRHPAGDGLMLGLGHALEHRRRQRLGGRHVGAPFQLGNAQGGGMTVDLLERRALASRQRHGLDATRHGHVRFQLHGVQVTRQLTLQAFAGGQGVTAVAAHERGLIGIALAVHLL